MQQKITIYLYLMNYVKNEVPIPFKANCADPDLMPPYQAAFDLGLHYLSKDLFTGKKNEMG